MLYWNWWESFWKSWAEAAAEGKNAVPKEDSRHRQGEEAFTEFLSNVNHDLRTPLNAVIGFAQIIENEMFGEVNPHYLEYARHIQESGYELLSKIEEFTGCRDGDAAEVKEPPALAARTKILAAAE